MQRNGVLTLKQVSSPTAERRTLTDRLRQGKTRARLGAIREERFLSSPSSPLEANVGERAVSAILTPTDAATTSSALHTLRYLTKTDQTEYIRLGLHKGIVALFTRGRIPTAINADTFSAVYILTNLAAGSQSDVAELKSAGLLSVLEQIGGNLIQEVNGRVESYSRACGEPATPLTPLTQEELRLACDLCEQFAWLVGNLVTTSRSTREAVFKGATLFVLAATARLLLRDMSEDNLTSLLWAVGQVIGTPLGLIDREVQPADRPAIGGCASILESLSMLAFDIIFCDGAAPAVMAAALNAIAQLYKQVYMLDLLKCTHAPWAHEGTDGLKLLICRLVALLGHSATDVVAASLKLLANLVLVCRRVSELILSLPVMAAIGPLVVSQTSRVARHAIVFLVNLATATDYCFLLQGDPAPIEYLVNSLVSPNRKIVSEVLWGLNTILDSVGTSYASEDAMIRALHTHKLVPALLEILRVAAVKAHVQMALKILNALVNMTYHEGPKGQSPFIGQLAEFGAKPILEKLTEASDTETYLLANVVLETVFDDTEVIE